MLTIDRAPTDTESTDMLSALLADAIARIYGLRAAWLWRCGGRGLAARRAAS